MTILLLASLAFGAEITSMQSMTGVVQRMNLEGRLQFYKITWVGKAPILKVPKESSVLQCLFRSLRENIEVEIQERDGVVVECTAPKKSTSN